MQVPMSKCVTSIFFQEKPFCLYSGHSYIKVSLILKKYIKIAKVFWQVRATSNLLNCSATACCSRPARWHSSKSWIENNYYLSTFQIQARILNCFYKTSASFPSHGNVCASNTCLLVPSHCLFVGVRRQDKRGVGTLRSHLFERPHMHISPSLPPSLRMCVCVTPPWLWAVYERCKNINNTY